MGLGVESLNSDLCDFGIYMILLCGECGCGLDSNTL